jgi:L-iditol 2-dehydrogenase
MADTMKAAVLHGIEDLRIEERPVPRLDRPDEVLVRIRAIGVCGSDIHFYRRGRIGTFVVEAPMILGHEAAGEVVEVGSEVTTLQPGDRVALEPGVPCRKCESCRTGQYNLCPDVVFFATPPVDGAYCDYVVSPADFAFKLPDSMSFGAGAMMEPLAVGFHAARRGGVTGGDTVAILGAGPIGQTALQAARAFGAAETIISDVVPYRLEFARKAGATHVVNAAESDVPAVVAELTGGRGADAVMECAGAPDTLAQGIKMARRGGKIVVIGLPTVDELALPMHEITTKEADLCGIFRYANVYGRAVAATAAGQCDVESLITHRYGLLQSEEALLFADEHKDECMKVLVEND